MYVLDFFGILAGRCGSVVVLKRERAGLSLRAGGPGIFPGYYDCVSPATFIGNKRKTEPKELPSCTIPLLLFAYTRRLEVLATALRETRI